MTVRLELGGKREARGMTIAGICEHEDGDGA
jgi:hypothetical protein